MCAVVAGLVVGDRFLGLFDRIRHEVLADRYRTFTPEREMTAIRGPADWADEGVFSFNSILREFGLNVTFLEVDEGHVAAAKFHLVVTIRGFGTDLRRGQAF